MALSWCEYCNEPSLALKKYTRHKDNKPMQVWICLNKHCKRKKLDKK